MKSTAIQRAPVRYFGGKGTMINKLLSYFPDSNTYSTYVEPYGGSGVVLLNKPKKEVEIYNDIYELIYNLYKVLQNKEQFTQFHERVSLMPYSEQMRSDFKEMLSSGDKLDPVTKALAYFYTNYTSVNGLGGFSTNHVVRRKLPKAISDYLSAIERLESLHQRLSNVIITNSPACSVISKFDKDYVFIYCDPPYVPETRTAVRYPHEEDHDKLLRTLLTLKHAKVCLSGYNSEQYDILLEHGWTRQDFDVKAVSGDRKSKTKTESVWYNYVRGA